MKKTIFVLVAILVCLCVVACLPMTPPTTTGSQPTTTSTAPTTPTTNPPLLQGWQEAQGNRYFYHDDGTMATGWTDVEGSRYYFAADGVMHTGWLEQEGSRYYLKDDGAMAIGWEDLESGRYYFAADGVMHTGWLEWEENCYYLDDSGILHTGWLEEDGERYYCRDDGAIARGMLEIDGVRNYFTSSGAYILLVNPWHYLPEDYDPDLVSLSSDILKHDGAKVSRICKDALEQMIRDCTRECSAVRVISSYRTQAFQEQNFERKVQQYIQKGYSRKDAEELAATEVARPGTSEHQSGLAVDITDENRWWDLTDNQANMPAQKWLMENSWRYGFILRFGKDKQPVTGVTYEPWHYRYVGLAVAAELHESGLALEEYLDSLS